MDVEARVDPAISSGGESQNNQDSTVHVLQLTNVLHMLRRRWKLIFGVALLPLVVATAFILSLTPRYSAEAIVSLDQRTNTVIDADAVLSKLSGDAATVQAQLQILTSRSFLSRVIDKTQLASRYYPLDQSNSDSPLIDFAPTWLTSWFKPDDPIKTRIESTQTAEEAVPAERSKQEIDSTSKISAEEAQTAKDAAIDDVLSALTVSPVGVSSAIRIEFRAYDPYLAAELANLIAQTYIEDQLNAKFEATDAASNFLSDRINDLEAEVQAADAAVARFRSTNDVLAVGQGPSSADQQLGALNSELVLAKLNLNEQIAKVERIRELEQTGRSVDITQVVDSPLIAQLRTEESDLQRLEAELSSKYGPRHPRIIDLQSQKTDLQRKITGEVSRIARAASSEVNITRTKVASLEQNLKALERTMAGRNLSVSRLKQLEEHAASARSLYETSLTRLEQIKDREEIQRPDARILSSAAVPRERSFPPNKLLMFGLAAPASLFLGFLAAVARELRLSGFRTSAQLERSLTLPVLAVAPEVKSRKARRSVTNIVNDRPYSSFAESIRGIQLGLSPPDVRPPKVILVTSAIPQEGKSTVALSLARSAARNGQKVVLLDCDFRRSNLLAAVRIDELQKGLVAILLNRENVEHCFQKDPESSVLLLAPETSVDNPASLLGSVEMENLVRDLRGLADLIIIDSAPLLPVNDTKLLLRWIDTTLFVVRWEKTPRNAAIAAVRSLFDLRAPIAGIVVTRADSREYYAYTYGLKDYSNYARYYRD